MLRRSREGAWIEIGKSLEYAKAELGRSREGAWIEISLLQSIIAALAVAPARERGLKLKSAFYVAVSMASRSREGAWIEIRRNFRNHAVPRVAPARERGLKLRIFLN